MFKVTPVTTRTLAGLEAGLLASVAANHRPGRPSSARRNVAIDRDSSPHPFARESTNRVLPERGFPCPQGSHRSHRCHRRLPCCQPVPPVVSVPEPQQLPWTGQSQPYHRRGLYRRGWCSHRPPRSATTQPMQGNFAVLQATPPCAVAANTAVAGRRCRRLTHPSTGTPILTPDVLIGLESSPQSAGMQMQSQSVPRPSPPTTPAVVPEEERSPGPTSTSESPPSPPPGPALTTPSGRRKLLEGGGGSGVLICCLP